MQAKQLKSSLIHSQNGLFEQTVTVKNLLTRKPSLLIFAISCVLAASVWVIAPSIHNQFFQGQNIENLAAINAIEFYLCCTWSIIILLTGTVIAILLALTDTHRKRHLQKHLLLQSIVESEPECVKTVSADGRLLSMNPAGLTLVEADDFALIEGQPVLDLIAPEFRDAFIHFHERVIQGESLQLQFDIIGLKGTRKTMETHAVPLTDEISGEVLHLAITRDVTESKNLSNKLRYQACHDILTGLVNRSEFERRLEQSLLKAQSEHCAHAVFFLDLDQFKVVNDTCGHLAGDKLLKNAADIMRASLRKHDTIARFGGDEFAVLLDHCSPEEAQSIANSLRLKIEALDFCWEERVFKTTCSIGVVFVDHQTSDTTEILSNADAACYVAKDRGRNRVYVRQADDETVLNKQGEMQWVAKIHDGIAKNAFCLYAQKIVGTGQNINKTHAEILVRYIDETGRIVPPGAFLPAAERYGVILKLDRYIIESTIQYLSQYPQLLSTIDIFSINLSGQSLADEEFLTFVLDQFNGHPKLATRICFEITETAAISNLAGANEFIHQVKMLGCKIALDDFGTGLSSFAYLKNLDVDSVKIDGEFIKNITTDPLDLAMTRSINDIAHEMGKLTIAEFVENDEIRSKLCEVGVDYMQGYGIHKPQPIEELLSIDENAGNCLAS